MVTGSISSSHCYFVTDLHGNIEKYNKLFNRIREIPPAVLFLGGDLLPSPLTKLSRSPVNIGYEDFLNGYLALELKKLKGDLKDRFPRIFVILGNDDGRLEESTVLDIATQGLWEYCHDRCIPWHDFTVYGYAYIPPTPFQLKDWERFDVSRYVPPGCTAPEEGTHSIPQSEYQLKWTTITEDLDKLTGQNNLGKAILLFHTPPYQTNLDRAALDGKMIDYVPLDIHVGSIAIRRFIEERQPWVTLHGHVHESTRLTGSWRDKINQTQLFNAAHDGPELALVQFDPYHPENAIRELI